VEHDRANVSAWSTVALSLGSAGIGAAAALTGTSMQLRHARRDRERSERAAWRDRGASVLGPIMGVLDDMEPRAIAEHGGRSQQTIENVGRRWWKARDELLVFGAANPSDEIARASQELAEAVARAWTSVITLNRVLEGADAANRALDPALLDRVCNDHAAAATLAQRLGELSREGPAA
jgi:hypothetical protein